MARRNPRHPLGFASLDAAWREFLGAPATGGYGTNEALIESQVGSANKPLTGELDSVREHFGRKSRGLNAIRTFKEAFKACFGNRRDWSRFRIDVLRLTDGAEMRHLQLPERVDAALEREAIIEADSRLVGEMYAGSYVPPSSYDGDTVPLELLRRHGRASRGQTRRVSVTYLKRAVATKKALAKCRRARVCTPRKAKKARKRRSRTCARRPKM